MENDENAPDGENATPVPAAIAATAEPVQLQVSLIEDATQLALR